MRTHTHACCGLVTHMCIYTAYMCLHVVCAWALGVFTWISEGWLMDMKHLQGERGNGVLLGLSPQETPAKTSKRY